MAFILRNLGSYYSKKTLILGTFKIENDRIVYTVVEKDVVHKLFGFPVLVHSEPLNADDWHHIIS